MVMLLAMCRWSPGDVLLCREASHPVPSAYGLVALACFEDGSTNSCPTNTPCRSSHTCAYAFFEGITVCSWEIMGDGWSW